ncbi:hypothetical protein BGZ68_001040 [Mortierella alpina]|nr:hypothetical protein BGZ68_001040 [Mortierella alpina]
MSISPGLKLGTSVDQTAALKVQFGGCQSSEGGAPWSISFEATVVGRGLCAFPSPLVSMQGSGAGHLQWMSQAMTGMDKVQLTFDLQGDSVTMAGAVVEGKFQGKGAVLKANIDSSSFSEIVQGCVSGGVKSPPIHVTSLNIDD